MTKNRLTLIAIMALAVVLGGATTIIFLEKSIHISDRAEADNTLSSAQHGGQVGGVDKEGAGYSDEGQTIPERIAYADIAKRDSWYSGEGLKQGDFFSYKMCHIDYKECSDFYLDMWIKGDKQIGSETKWLTEVVVYDGRKVIVGEIELGKIAPEPTGGSEELGVYRGAFKSSIVWLSAFATADGSSGGKGPKEFDLVSWGKIGNIGGEQVIPSGVETITVPAGTWETYLISWKTGGHHSYIWVVDDFPFPIKAHTLTHVSEGIPPPEYKFELLKYEQYVQQSPFEGIISTPVQKYCDTNLDRNINIKKPTNNFQYQIHAFYGPEDPVQGCEMTWLIKFISKFDDTKFLNQVKFDFLVVDENLTPTRSIAQEEGKNFLYSQSGQYILDMIVKEEPGDANYVIWVYGLSPEAIVPTELDDYLLINVPIFAGDGSSTPIPTQEIPEWVKNNAEWWADGIIDDDSFVRAIQFLIKDGVMQIPHTSQNTGGGTNEIPEWVKNNAEWWADGIIDDDSFVRAIQFLIKDGIITISS